MFLPLQQNVLQMLSILPAKSMLTLPMYVRLCVTGGVAILGSASADGENRAQKAIEEALNSPLLNDNEIRGAKWILININSSEGDHEFTMDEVEIIQNYLLSHAGENSDVILGMGYDNTLGSKLGITLIATGFEHKNPFDKSDTVKTIEPKKEEKILMTLGTPAVEQKVVNRPVPTFESQKMEEPVAEQPAAVVQPVVFQPAVEEELVMPTAMEQPVTFTSEGTRKITVENLVEKKEVEEKNRMDTFATSPLPTTKKKFQNTNLKIVLRRLQLPGDTLQGHPISMLKNL